MKALRKEDISLYLYIKDVVLRDFRERSEYVDLELIPEYCVEGSFVYGVAGTCPSDDVLFMPTERGRGWVYFDDPTGGSFCEPYPTISGLNGDGDPAFGTPEQDNQVIVYETTYSGLSVVSWRDYMIDYVDGRIVSTRELQQPKITYTWNYVSVVDEWEHIQAANPPIVAINLLGTDKFGYQLGGGKRSVRKGGLYIFASNNAERNDLSEVLYDSLYNRSCPLYNFPSGTILDYDGTFYGRRDLDDRIPESLIMSLNKLTYLFDREHMPYMSTLKFDSVSARDVTIPMIMTRGRKETTFSDLNAYRAKVTFDMYSFDDRNIR